LQKVDAAAAHTDRSAMRVRKLEPADVAEVAALFTETVRSVNARDYGPEQLEAWAPRPPDIAAWERSLAGRTALVVEVDGEVAGFGDLADGGHLDRLYVHRDHQRRGVATALAEALEAEAARQGAAEITADASITALPFFERRGYETLARQEQLHRGVRFTNYRVSKRLNPYPPVV
jgi:putative acetyltransferase